VCAAATPVAALARQTLPPEQVLAEAARYTVKIKVQNEIAFNQDEGGSASGTGFLIDRQRGWVLTNAHVATRSPSVVKVSFKGGEQIEARRIHVDPLIDFAILSIPSKSIPAAAIEAQLACDGNPASGTSVMAYGHPWGMKRPGFSGGSYL
jgi:S1-C subfamily serine protease